MPKLLTLHIPLGYQLAFTTDAVTSGQYTRLGDPGGTKYTPTVMTVSTDFVLGPYNEPRYYELSYSGNDFTRTLTQVGLLSPDVYTNIAAWTPTITGASVAGTGTYTTQVGYYQVIGKMVHICANIVWTAHTGSGTMKLNLPVVSKTNVKQAILIPQYNVSTSSGYMVMEIASNSSTGTWYYVSTATKSAVDMDTAGEIVFTAWYFTE